jgi:tRNA (guanine37-N1)-methyltransferase
MKFDIITIFPGFFSGPLDYGIVRRARELGLTDYRVHDLREFTHDRHHTVDDRPFGGGEGMVLKPEPIFECAEKLQVAPREMRVAGQVKESVVLLSAHGQRFDQSVAEKLAALERVVLICGRYEGVDERVNEFLADRELSIGDYVLSGGELAAAAVLDAVTRLIPGALGNEASARQESFSANKSDSATRTRNLTGDVTEKVGAKNPAPDSTCGSGGLLDYPHYTRPAQFRAMGIPEVLLSGDHDQIRQWRRRSALQKTLRNRPDLLQQVELSAEDKNLLAQLSGKEIYQDRPC